MFHVSFGDSVDDASTGPAALQGEHETGAVGRAAAKMGPEAEAPVVAAHVRAMPLGPMDGRVPDQRAVSEDPDVAGCVGPVLQEPSDRGGMLLVGRELDGRVGCREPAMHGAIHDALAGELHPRLRRGHDPAVSAPRRVRSFASKARSWATSFRLTPRSAASLTSAASGSSSRRSAWPRSVRNTLTMRRSARLRIRRTRPLRSILVSALAVVGSIMPTRWLSSR